MRAEQERRVSDLIDQGTQLAAQQARLDEAQVIVLRAFSAAVPQV